MYITRITILQKHKELFAIKNSKIEVYFKDHLFKNRFMPNCPSMISGDFHHGIPSNNNSIVIDYYAELNSEFDIESIKKGGIWYPRKCKPVHEPIALILPVKGRIRQLKLYLSRIHPFLQQQNIPYVIITVNQTGKEPFNRGVLFNVGVLHIPSTINCFILSDVDLIPDRYDNMFTCNELHPKHMSPAVSKFDYKLPYEEIFGGIVAFTREQFYRINGFSTRYWGWGGEDDDLFKRTIKYFKNIYRVPLDIGRITHMNHYINESGDINNDRYKLLKDVYDYSKDGLNNTLSICTVLSINYLHFRTDITVHC
ncbi:hypothetical protein GJ496_011607 [Pomphorhynchus laevis]|nr:hypothetical protein GJ496_011607 [Pomphorhynchus laevis]